jgi:hypothetical protein
MPRSVREVRVLPVGYLLLADSHRFICRTWDALAARLVWARNEGYRTANARRANRYGTGLCCHRSGRGS